MFKRVFAALTLLGSAGCASPDLVETGAVDVVSSSELPPPSRTDLTAGTRPHLLGPGDTLAVDVFGLSELSRQVQIDSDGNVALPLAGTVGAVGRTPEELAAAIEDSLRASYVRDPRVSVGIIETVSQAVTVGGEVERPGVYPIIGPVTLMRTVARAEGTTDFANSRHVVIFRTVDGQRMAALYDLKAIQLGAMEDPEIYSHDVVIVGESTARRLFPQIAQFASLLVTPLVYILDNNN